MRNSEISKRLEKIEGSLSPQQALLVAMEKAFSRFQSLEQCET